ncbi:MAG: HAMP domain-containing histidine kinase [Spirochaetes bacterium]|nr:HAMP domain-containing histidine kinase [Spirochaetota bacterium]
MNNNSKDIIIRLQKEIKLRESKFEKYINVISHDFKSPIITIKGFIELLEKDIKNNKTNNLDDYIKFIKESADKLLFQLNGLLKLSRFKKITGKIQKIDLNMAVKETINSFNILEKTNGVKFEIVNKLPVIYANKDLISELFHILIDNSIKFMDKQRDQLITIGSKKKQNEDLIYVNDKGIGIDPKYFEKIFNVFEKVDNKNTDAGVGLTIAKEIIDFHNGRIWVESDGIGKGSTFYFTIPKCHE